MDVEHLEKEEKNCTPIGVEVIEAPVHPTCRSKPRHNIISRLFFCWIDPLFWLGCWRSFSKASLIDHPDEVDSEQLLAVFNKYWEKNDTSTRSLPITLFRCLWRRIIINGVLVSAEKGLLVVECILLGYFTEYFSIAFPSHKETRDAYLYATGIVVVTFTLATFYAHGSLVAQKTGMMARVMVTAAVYTKVLKVDHFNGAHTSAGQVISLIGNDVNKFDQAFLFLHYLWIGPTYIIVYTILVYQEIGASAFVALGFVVVLVPVQWLLGWIFNECRHELSKAAERRVKVMTETIGAMRFIKMCALEDVFQRLLHTLRHSESYQVIKTSVTRAISFSLFNVALAVIMLLVVSSYTATGGVLTPQKFFTVLSLTSTLRVTSIHFFILAVLNLLDCRVATTRIQEYLSRPNPDVHPQGVGQEESLDGNAHKNAESNTHICLTTHNLSASWTNRDDELTLKDITFSVNEEFPLLVLVGPVAAGKSTLLRSLLGELKALKGTVEVKGKVSYASQDPWVFSGTLRENVLFGSPFEKEWYNTVIEACALDKDISGFLEGDMTMVGDKGVSLSGGQRARVNLARAVYHKADIYILDDPLSAVDTAVARHIFEKCIGNILKHKLVVLATNQLQFAHKASKLLAIKEGAVVAFCRPCDLPSKGINSAHLVHAKDEDQFKVSWDEDGKKLQCPDQQERMLLSPLPKRPSIFDAISFRSARSRQASLFETTSIYSHTSNTDNSWMSTIKEMLSSNSEMCATKTYHTIGIMTYIRYFLSGGCWAVLLGMLVIFLLGEGSFIAGDVWMSKWADCFSSPNSSNTTLQPNLICSLSTSQKIVWLMVITIAAVALNVTRIIMIFYVAINASHVLHNRAVLSVLRAPVRFFDVTPLGNIANCFSKDVNLLDEVLPFMLCDNLMLITRCLAVFAIAVSANAYIIGPAAVFLILILCLRWYYLRTSRQLKNLESFACSPLYSHTTSTLQGLLTIKTVKKESVVTKYFHQYLNLHSKMWYLCLAGTRWFGMRIDYITCLFVAVSAFTSVHLATALNGNLVGLGLAYTITLTGMLQYCVRLSGEVECVMLSAERLMQYSELDQENLAQPCSHIKKQPDWPQMGEIEITNVSFFYSSDTPLVLKSLTCHIRPGEKIGVVGRTGAGKSSLGALLLELSAHTGTITIDGVDISQIEKHSLRRKISFVPQQPVLFGGTLRFNLDPYGENTDDEIWKSLEHVQLKSVVQNMEGGLESQVSEGGSNFSVGQRQLVCLARALLRKNKVLVLDEVTSNVDAKTDLLIQKIIRESFYECTTLIIAHHLNTLMDCDRILVLDGGRIKEFEHAHILFQNPNSLFRKMVAQIGSSAATKLHNIAREDFNHRLISSVQDHRTVIHGMIEITEESERDGSTAV